MLTRATLLLAFALAGAACAGGNDHGARRVTMQAVGPVTPHEMQSAARLIHTRLQRLRVRPASVRVHGRQFVITIPSDASPERAADAAKQGLIEFYDLETSVTGPSAGANGTVTPTGSLFELLTRVKDEAKRGTPGAFYLFDAKKKHVAGPAPTQKELLELADLKRLPKGFSILAAPQKTAALSCSPEDGICPNPDGGFEPTTTVYYLFKHDPSDESCCGVIGVPQVTNGDLKFSETRYDFDPQTNQPNVLMTFTGKGSKKLQKMTAMEWGRGKTRGTPQHFAIVLDREIRSFPQIDPNDSQLAGGINDGVQITGLGSGAEAREIAVLINTGALPVSLVRVH